VVFLTKAPKTLFVGYGNPDFLRFALAMT